MGFVRNIDQQKNRRAPHSLAFFAPVFWTRNAAQECNPRREAWVHAAEAAQAPEGRKKLIPDIPLVVCNLVLLQKRNVLLLERVLLMMFLLRCDVPRNGRHV